MRTLVLTLATCLLFTGLVFSPAAQADDLTIVSRTTPSKGSAYTSTQYISPDRIRTNDDRYDTIIDLRDGSITQVDNKKKTYSKTTFEEMRAHFAELEEMVGSNPIMKKMFGKTTDVDVQKTSETREIAGYPCVKYILSMGAKFRFDIWVTSEIKPPVEYYDARKMLYAAMGPSASRFEKMFDEMKKIDGLALATDIDMKVMGFDASSESTATEVRKGALGDDVFAIPSGYKNKGSAFDK